MARWTLPNALTLSRLLSTPALLALAFTGHGTAFVALYGYALVTDILDGKLARWLNQQSEFGAKLDSWADFALYMTVPLDAWWLRPDFVRAEAATFTAIVLAYTVPVLIGLARYRRITSYHTRGAVLAAYAVGASSFAMFAGAPAWPMRFAAAFLVLAELEEIAITALLPEWTANVPTLAHALRRRTEAVPGWLRRLR
jgi:CDP-diacylglycerol--glycerol-3-phosphate 3-phosphatidyltransferase